MDRVKVANSAFADSKNVPAFLFEELRRLGRDVLTAKDDGRPLTALFG